VEAKIHHHDICSRSTALSEMSPVERLAHHVLPLPTGRAVAILWSAVLFFIGITGTSPVMTKVVSFQHALDHAAE
jgi:hypothetical protein